MNRSRIFRLAICLALALLAVGLGGLSVYRKVQAFQPLGFEAVAAGGRVRRDRGAERPSRACGRGPDPARQRRRGRDPRTSSSERLEERPDERAARLSRAATSSVQVRYRRPAVAFDFPYLILALIGAVYLGVGLFTLVRHGGRQGFLFYLWCLTSATLYLLSPTPPVDLAFTAITLFDDRRLHPAAGADAPPLPGLPVAAARAPSASGGWLPFLYLPAAALLALQLDLMLARGRWLFGGVTAARVQRPRPARAGPLRRAGPGRGGDPLPALPPGRRPGSSTASSSGSPTASAAATCRSCSSTSCRTRSIAHVPMLLSSVAVVPLGAGAADLRLRHPALQAVGHRGHRPRHDLLDADAAARHHRLLADQPGGQPRRLRGAVAGPQPAVVRLRPGDRQPAGADPLGDLLGPRAPPLPRHLRQAPGALGLRPRAAPRARPRPALRGAPRRHRGRGGAGADEPLPGARASRWRAVRPEAGAAGPRCRSTSSGQELWERDFCRSRASPCRPSRCRSPPACSWPATATPSR